MSTPRVVATSNIVREDDDSLSIDLQLSATVPGGSTIRVNVPRESLQGLLDAYSTPRSGAE